MIIEVGGREREGEGRVGICFHIWGNSSNFSGMGDDACVGQIVMCHCISYN